MAITPAFRTIIDFDDDDDVAPLPTCVACGEPVIHSTRTWEYTCSKACEAVLDRLDASTGTCAWCGRYGPLGKPCIRKVPGTDEREECGTFG